MMDPFSILMGLLSGGGGMGGGGSPLTGGGPSSIFDQMASPFQPPQQPGQPLDIGSASGGAPNLSPQMPPGLQNWLNQNADMRKFQQSQIAPTQWMLQQSQIAPTQWMQPYRPPQFRIPQ
jgi:hypothetical protein